jgi:hypothetical protein
MAEYRTVQISIPNDVEEKWFLSELYLAVGNILSRRSGSVFSTEAEEQDLEGPLVETPSTAYVGDELEANIGRFARDITQHARRLLRAIAEVAVDGDGISSERLRDRLDADNSGTIGGWAASIGFAVKRLRLPKPYKREYEYLAEERGWVPVYRMDPEIARVLLRIVDEDGDVLE